MSPEEVAQALQFFGFSKSYDSQQLKQRYRELALKYHPDRGEYTSEVLFLELVRYKTVLELFLEEGNATVSTEEEITDEYGIYKKAKKTENDAIYEYFHKRDGEPLVLDETINPELKKLRQKLQQAIHLYRDLLQRYPDSMWKADVKDSLEKMKVWWK
ncbi:MAG: molecular chaperone DnaJ [Spirochaetota bacterium]